VKRGSDLKFGSYSQKKAKLLESAHEWIASCSSQT